MTRINSISAHSSCSFWTRLINMLSSFPRNGFAGFFIIRNQRVPFIECRVFSPRHFSAFIHTKYRARRKLSISAGDLLFLEILLFSHYRNFLSAGLVELLLPGEHLARYNTAESVARRYTHSNEGNIRNRARDDDDVGNAELLLCGLPGAYPEHE